MVGGALEPFAEKIEELPDVAAVRIERVRREPALEAEMTQPRQNLAAQIRRGGKDGEKSLGVVGLQHRRTMRRQA